MEFDREFGEVENNNYCQKEGKEIETRSGCIEERRVGWWMSAVQLLSIYEWAVKEKDQIERVIKLEKLGFLEQFSKQCFASERGDEHTLPRSDPSGRGGGGV